MIELKVGVKIFLKSKEGKYLFICRSTEKYPEVGPKWDIPSGRINAGETLMENLKREVLEETGLTLAGQQVLVGAQDILKGERHIVRLTYMGEADGEVTLSDEHSEYKWLKPEDFGTLEPMDVYVKELLDMYQEKFIKQL